VFVVNDENKYLFRLRKDVSFMNKPIIKNKLEEVPEDSFVLIDAQRADFIDRDVVEVIEDFMIHAPLKNIRVDLKLNATRQHGFDAKILRDNNPKADIVRTVEKKLETAAAEAWFQVPSPKS
jgi:MFS superfamily sulfate permease-like transporter